MITRLFSCGRPSGILTALKNSRTESKENKAIVGMPRHQVQQDLQGEGMTSREMSRKCD